jgi:hypothetical protein
MSRHKMIKNLDLDEELDEYDGVDDYDYGYELEATEADTGGAEGAEGARFLKSPEKRKLRHGAEDIFANTSINTELSEEDKGAYTPTLDFLPRSPLPYLHARFVLGCGSRPRC